ncbi:MAG TPA: response regulator [Leptolyngbyaceae cyanobacterium M33_DOE_097]|uniref:Response regulator n=1 Tax=Oscillatoriales cyanobacterium SpSt-418 TaxID=2282169 RepID=A0A7C3PF15_9CYAN|nr:response regulator [Leptolyngbyaceae cyanobacterium M33_DOE_097]
MNEICVHPDQCLAGIQVLLVEDEVDVAFLLQFILKNAGAEVVWVRSVSKAFEQLQYSQPDILVCDVKLPDQNGDRLIQQIRQLEMGTSLHLPAIALSSYTREISAEKMIKAGFERFLPKDFDAEQLISSVLALI